MAGLFSWPTFISLLSTTQTGTMPTLSCSFRKGNQIRIAFNSLHLLKFRYGNYEAKGGEVYVNVWRDAWQGIPATLPLEFLLYSCIRPI